MNESSSLLKVALAGNGAFSLMTGVLLAAVPATVGDWLGVSIDGWLRALGLALLVHGVVLLWVARRPDPFALGRLNLAMIAPYPVMMIVLAATSLVEPSLGKALVLGDGFVVGVLAVMHAIALKPLRGTQPVAAGAQ